LIACSHRYDTVVTRGGSVRSFHVEGTTSGQLIPIIRANISKEAFIISDELKVYGALGKEYWMHQTVNHSIGEYVRGIVHTNNDKPAETPHGMRHVNLRQDEAIEEAEALNNPQD
jgi:hypothetical protein